MSFRVHAGEKSLYDFLWLDPDKKVYVLQNKLFKKEHSFYADIGYLSNFNSKFQDTNGFALRAGYFIQEEWGLELYYNQYSNRNNSDWESIRAVNGADPFVRKMDKSFGAFVIWSPFYGKINTFNKIYYFDWSFGLGVGKVETQSNLKTVSNANLISSFEKESYNAVAWKTNLKFHINENTHLGVEWVQHHYSAPSAKNPNSDLMRTNQDLIFSIGWSY
jgi:outer membrane beta-barrel protein